MADLQLWPALLQLEKGHRFPGWGFGRREVRGGEVVFNTGMTGYQEILSDPSYAGQIVVMTYPHIGNTGTNLEDQESRGVWPEGLVMAELATPSSWRSKKALPAYLEEHGRFGLTGIDTRKLTEILRKEGSQNGIVLPLPTNGIEDIDGSRAISTLPSMVGRDLVREVTCKQPWEFGSPSSKNPSVVVYDYGVKHSILSELHRRHFRVWVVPATFPPEELGAFHPQAIVLSNGPGDPAAVEGVLPILQNLLGRYPLFGICMGHQLLGRALGAKTEKLNFGHHGVNHPVRDEVTRRVYITSHNHGFAVERESLKHVKIVPRFVSLNDGTVEGFQSEKLRLFSTQFHPEASPGPREALKLFDTFVEEFVRGHSATS